MVSEILTAANINHKEVRFLQPPASTFAVWFDAEDARGSDSAILLVEHSSTIELYSPSIDANAEANIEAELEIRALDYQKSDRRWLEKEQWFMTVYTFDYIEKRR